MTNDRMKKTAIGWAVQPSPEPRFERPQPAHPGSAAYPPYHAPAQATYPQPGYPPQAAYPQYIPPPQQPGYPPYHAPPQPAYPPSPQAPYGAAPPPYQVALPSYAMAPPAQPPGQLAGQGEAADSTHRTIRKADAAVGRSRRVRFIRLTYLHLLGAIGAFAGLLYLFMTQDVLVARVSTPLVRFALGGRANWGIVLAAFVAISWVADTWASHARSRAVQYAGLAFYVVAEALIFIPLLAIVEWKTQAILARGGGEPHIIRDAAYVTLGIFTALTLSVFVSNKDFSFLRSGLAMASGAALSLIVLSLTFGFNLGLVFSVAMVLLAAGYVLFQTSRVLAHYDPRQHVAASLALFSSLALMFWYVIRIFLRARD
jgi:FtsH-binding integral membrane protein